MKFFRRVSLILLLASFGLQAQFYGGNGDGFSVDFTTAFFHDNTFSLYRGGIGDGASNIFSSFSMDGSGLKYFNGASGDGFSSAMASLNLAGEEVFLYFGGNGDGFSLGTRGAFLSVNGPCVEALIKQIDSDPITSGLYEAGSQLLSKGKVRSGNNVNFSAGNSITLEPGFIAENNTLFLAIIKNCLTNPVNY